MIGSISIISRNSNIPAVDLDGEVATMNPDKGKYYGFDSVASRIWELIREPIMFKKIIESLLFEYNVDTQTCEQDVGELLDKLKAEGLIEILEGGDCHI